MEAASVEALPGTSALEMLHFAWYNFSARLCGICRGTRGKAAHGAARAHSWTRMGGSTRSGLTSRRRMRGCWRIRSMVPSSASGSSIHSLLRPTRSF